MIALERLLDTAAAITVIRSLASPPASWPGYFTGSDGAPLTFKGADHPHRLLITEGESPANTGPIEWSVTASPYRRFDVGDTTGAGCLVMVRQPLRVADIEGAKDWVQTVMAALDTGAPEELLSANFLVARDGRTVINLAQWASPEAHRAAVQPADFGTQGSLGQNDAWRRTRSHPSILPDHDVERYLSPA